MNISSYQCRFGSYSLAGPQDQGALSALARSVAENGDMRLITRREPDFFADRNPLGKSAVVLGRGVKGTPMFMCEMREYPVYVAGKAARAVHLGLMRVAGDYVRHVGVWEHGFLALRNFARRLGFCDEFFTSIPYDNEPVRRILEAGLPRLPRYAMLGDVQNLLLPVPDKREELALPDGYAITVATPDDAKDLEGLLAASGSGWSYSPAISAGKLAPLLAREGGHPGFSGMLVLRHKGLPVGCVGVWDQRGQRQVWVEGYSLGTMLSRSFQSLVGGGSGLPAPGKRLELVFLPFFSLRHSHAKAGELLLRRAQQYAGALEARICSLGLSEQNPLRHELHLKGRTRRIRIYRVLFPGSGTTAAEARYFAPQPEIALL